MPTVPPKPFVSTNSVSKICDIPSFINGHCNNKIQIDKNLMNIPNQKIHDNHARMFKPIETLETFEAVKLTTKEHHKKETFISNKELIKEKEINEENGHMSPKTELTLNSTDIQDKKQEKLSDYNSFKTNLKSKKKIDCIKNNTSILHVE